MIRTAATRKRQPWRTMAGLVFAMLLIGFVLTSSFAQVLVGSGGHALDASLQLGSAGYNTQTRSSTVLRNQYNYNRYGNSPYRVNSFGGYSYNPRYNSLARPQYSAAGSYNRWAAPASVGFSSSGTPIGPTYHVTPPAYRVTPQRGGYN